MLYLTNDSELIVLIDGIDKNIIYNYENGMFRINGKFKTTEQLKKLNIYDKLVQYIKDAHMTNTQFVRKVHSKISHALAEYWMSNQDEPFYKEHNILGIKMIIEEKAKGYVCQVTLGDTYFSFTDQMPHKRVSHTFNIYFLIKKFGDEIYKDKKYLLDADKMLK